MVDAARAAEVRERLVAFARRRVADPSDAEDVVQDVLARVLRHPGAPRGGAALEHWLFASVRNALADHHRRRAAASRRLAVLAAEGSALAPEPPTDDDLRAALAGCVRPLLRELPVAYADAVRAVDLEGERQVDVAARTGTPLPTVKSRVQRGRTMLREAFEACCAITRDARGRPVEAVHRGTRPCILEGPARA